VASRVDDALPIPLALVAALRAIRRRLGSLAAYEGVLAAASAVTLGPVLALAMSSLIRLSGTAAISNADLVTFALSVPGFLAIVLASSSGVAIAYAKQTGIIHLVARGPGERASTAAALLLALRSLPVMLRLGMRQLAVYGLVALPFLGALVLIHALLLGGKDINFYLATKPPMFWTALGLAGMVCIGGLGCWLALYLRWLHAVPLVIFDGLSPADAMKSSALAVRTRTKRTILMLGTWAVASGGTSVTLTAIVMAVSAIVIRSLSGNLKSVLPIVALLWALELIVPLAMLVIWFNGHCVLKTRLYREAFHRDEAVPSSPGAIEVEQRIEDHGLSWRLVLVLAAMGLTTAAIAVTYSASEFLARPDNTTITAHRGSSRRAPENSLAAIEAAIEDGAHVAEIDVQELADGTIVVFHDTDLMRIARDRRRIWDVTYEDIRDLDAGSWFDPVFANERIPTLREAIGLARGRIRLNIELKFHGREKAFVESVVGILREEQFLDQAVITSLDHRRMADVRRFDASLPLGAIVTVAIGDIAAIDADFFSVEASLATPRMVFRMRSLGKSVHVWTINDRRRMGRFVDIGVASIITDEPAMLAAVMSERAAMTPGERLLGAYRNRRAR
jgi:glycerophosphoryl diester phosphodiesterase